MDLKNIDYDNLTLTQQFGLLVSIGTFFLSGFVVLFNRLIIMGLIIIAILSIFFNIPDYLFGYSAIFIVSSFFIYVILDTVCYFTSIIFDKNNSLNLRTT